jgi:hypothetical protein|nr:MAG TPA: hypothetical protein [Caudoviricetes sp.]
MKDFNYLRKQLLYRKIVKWEDNEITLDNGTRLSVEETERDCCASADGGFEDVVLDAAITYVGDIQYEPWEDEDTYGCSASVTIMHNRNIICKAVANADAGNGGYYYSIASFIVHPINEEPYTVHFVEDSDE